MVKKIVSYENSPQYGEWCNTITMVADDEYGQGGGFDGIDHIPATDRIAEGLIPENYDVQKIYLTEYPVIHDAAISGIRKPAAHESLLRQINRGSLIINFIGHGNEELWTHEHILVASDDLPRFNNGARQAFWIAATCDFARFDNPGLQSFAEKLVTLPGAGAIAVLSSCREAYASSNESLNRALFRYLFDGSNTRSRLGDVVMLAKNSMGNSINDQLYNLIGDPSLRLLTPSCSVKITEHFPDSMKALSLMEAAGNIQFSGQLMNDAGGHILFKTYDSRVKRKYKVNEWTTWSYTLAGNILFRGTATVKNGTFKTRFIVPKDITYGGSDGRFGAIYWQENIFGSGTLDHIFMGGTEFDYDDRDGPRINIGFDGQDFMTGGFVPPDPILKVTISDSVSGVNIAGDIGHKITMVLDHADDEKIVLNDFFEYEQDSYVTGNIVFPLTNLAEGRHHIAVKAWDNCNNSSQTESEFSIIPLDRLLIRDLFNFPDPFSSSTEFTFWASQECDVQIKIYTLSGRLICQLNQLKAENGFNHFRWDGWDQDGDLLANGVYLYKICASSFYANKKIFAEKIEKLVIMR